MIYKVNINGIDFTNDSSSPFWFKSIDGLASATYRNTMIVYSDRNGGTVPKQLKGIRVLTLNAGLDEDSCVSHLEARRQLMDALGFDEWKPVDIYLSDGKILRNYCKFDTPELPLEALRWTDFSIIMMCRYVEFDDVSGNTEVNSVEVREAVAGGWKQIANVVWKQSVGDGWKQYSGTGAENAVNAGTAPAYPTIYFYGEVQNPIIRNTSTGEMFKVNITTSSTDVIKVDTRLQATLLNGGNINALVDDLSTYFVLQSGDNLLEFINSDGDGYAVVEWYSSFGGV